MEQNNNSPQAETTLASSKETTPGTNSSRPDGHHQRPRSGANPRKQERDAKRRWMKPTVRRAKVLREENPPPGGEEADKSKIDGLKIIHFGGLGEVGRNMSAVQYDDEIILIDAGISFPNEQLPGIDFILPNVGYLHGKEHMVKAMFFTHGHMDHTGALRSE